MGANAVRLTAVWLALCALTATSWSFSPAHVGERAGLSVPITVAVLSIGFVKVRLVISHFMEVRTAPLWLRLATDGWLVALFGSILALYLY
jgi:hypothetical protein